MGVVSAGMHFAGALGGEFAGGLLLDGQTVDVCPEGNTGTVPGAFQQADHAGLQTDIQDLNVQLLQVVLDKGGGLILLETQLGVSVQVLEGFDEFALMLVHEGSYFFGYIYHIISPFCES